MPGQWPSHITSERPACRLGLAAAGASFSVPPVQLSRYEGLLLSIPNPDVLLSPRSSQEAVLSSRIEGTQATLGEVLEFEAEGTVEGADTERLTYKRSQQ